MAALCVSAWAGPVVLYSGPDRFEVEYTLDSLSQQMRELDGRPFIRLTAPGEFSTNPGWPQLPLESFELGIPPQGDIRLSFEILESSQSTLPHPVSPAPLVTGLGPTRSTSWPMAPAAYGGSAVLPSEDIVQADPPSLLRRLRTQRIRIHPVRYDPAGKRLLIAKRVRVSVHFPAGFHGLPGLDRDAMFYRHCLNYEIAKSWALSRPLRKARIAADLFEAGRQRYRVSISQGEEDEVKEGIYRMTGAWLNSNGVNITGVIADNIAMFAGSGRQLSENPDTTCPAQVQSIPVQIVDADRDGNFDAEDAILFYGQGTSAWTYDSADLGYEFYLNRYAKSNTYWLVLDTAGTKRMAVRPRTFDPAPLSEVTSVPGYWREESNFYGIGDAATGWFWKRLIAAPESAVSLTVRLSIPDAVASQPAAITLWGTLQEPLVLKTDGSQLTGGLEAGGKAFLTGSFMGNEELTISMLYGECEFNGLTVKYAKQLRPQNGRLIFYGTPSLAPQDYRIDPGTSGTWFCYRITDKWNAEFLDSVNTDQPFSIHDSSGNASARFVVQSSSSFATPQSITEDRAVQGESVLPYLRSPANRADYLIIASDSFLPAARQLASHRKAMLHDSIDQPVIAALSDVFDEFSGGLFDPVAIRDFILYTQRNWAAAPAMVVLFGDGSNDYKAYRYSNPNSLPPYLRPGSSCLDDFFVYLDPDELSSSNRAPDAIIARIPAATLTEALEMVNKIREVEDPARRILGPWRQRILLAADDDMAGGKPDDLANKHTPESEKVARAIEETNSAFELRKIYLFDYARDAKLQFPEATRDLIEAVNRGCAAVNYVGHGAHFGWADEQLFWSADADRLNNPGMYPLIFSASCSVGEFDLPSERTIYELMLRSPGKGACAAIGATRATYSDPNNRLNVAFFRQLLGASPFSQSSIGASLFQAKRAIADIGNSELYACFGDPALRLLGEGHPIRFDTRIDSLKARQVVTLSGQVLRSDGGLDASFDGTVLLQVLKGYAEKEHVIQANQDTIDYKIWDDFMFSGQTTIKAGRFSQSFMVPAKIRYGEARSRITAFAWDSEYQSAFGSMDSIYTGGTDTAGSSNDRQGPRIRFALGNDSLTGGTSFAEAGRISLPANLTIILEDSMGIDVTSQGPDEGLCLEIPGAMAKTNLNSRFRYEEGDFRRGSASILFEVGSIPIGKQTLIATARDGLGNVSQKSLALEISADSSLVLSDVFNYPNPFAGETRFYYKISQPSDVTIKIFSRSGRPVRVIQNALNPQVWDGMDQEGRRVGNNVYFYKIIARAHRNGQKTEKIEKLILAR